MGWVTYGAVIASISYLLYKHPPTSWDLGFLKGTQTQLSSPTKRDASAIAQPREILSECGPDTGAATKDEIIGNSGATTSREADDSAETTPKAQAVLSPPCIEIPHLKLDDPQTVSNKNGSEALKSQKNSLTPKILSPSTNTDTSVRALPIPLNTNSPAKTQQNAPTRPARPNLMPPPPRPPVTTSLRTPPSAAANLRVPPSSRPSSSTLAPLAVPGKPQRPSRPVVLEPGHSPLDWAALTSDPKNNLRGANLPSSLIRVTPSMLKIQNGRKGRDAWTSYQGKVYNITPFAPFHPGGKGELLRGSGKDSEKLFMEIHPWVNWDGMLAECMVGILVGESHEADTQESKLDEMD